MWRPKLPEYPIADWERRPFAERLMMACQSWSADGFGTRWPVYAAYLLKMAYFVSMWLVFCTLTTGMTLSTFELWWATPLAFEKLILWAMLYEGLGLGSGSGPLGGRHVPPVGGALYFLRPGTTKLPLFPHLPVLGGHTRTWFDVGLYLSVVVLLLFSLLRPGIIEWQLVALVTLIPLMGVCDRTVFYAMRSEVYLSVALCMLFAEEWIPASKFIWMAMWGWWAVSKLNRHFPEALAAMASNSPWTRFAAHRQLAYRDYPDDLRPSEVTNVLAGVGTLFAVVVPAMLLFSGGGPATTLGLMLVALFHLFVIANMPLGAPLEWNLVMAFGAAVLFGAHAEAAVLSISSPELWVWLIGFHVAVPLYGTLFPAFVSRLLSMRYSPGDQSFNLWLFRGSGVSKLDNLIKSSPGIDEQLGALFDHNTITAIKSKAMAFRAMQLHGRILRSLIPKAVADIEDYEWWDGELVAGLVLGWNLGEGHLSNQRLLDAVQAQCAFKPGELRCIFVEAQALQSRHVDWQVVDAVTGLLSDGSTPVAELSKGQPWDEYAEVFEERQADFESRAAVFVDDFEEEEPAVYQRPGSGLRGPTPESGVEGAGLPGVGLARPGRPGDGLGIGPTKMDSLSPGGWQD